MRRSRAMTLIELLVSLALLVGLFALTGSALRLAAFWSEASGQEVFAARRAEIVRLRVTNAVLGAQPVGALSLLASGALVEGAIPGAARTWGRGDLVLRGASGYTIVSRDGPRLCVQRIDPRGHVTVGPPLLGVKDTAFGVERDARGDPRGVSYRVAFERGPETAGFVALRTDFDPQPWVAPTPATRFGGRTR